MKQMLCLLRKRIFSSRITHALFYDVLVDGVKGSMKPLIYRTSKTRDYVAMLYQLKVLLCYPIIRRDAHVFILFPVSWQYLLT